MYTSKLYCLILRKLIYFDINIRIDMLIEIRYLDIGTMWCSNGIFYIKMQS